MIEKNKNYNVKITAINSSGFGVCRIDGIVCFVSGGVTGDELTVRIIKTKKNYCIGRIEKIIVPSEKRAENDCEIFKKCGGCVYRNMKYSCETEIKALSVADAFERIAHLDVDIKPIISAENTSRYRNKAQFPVGFDSTVCYAGFYATRSHTIVPCEDCLLQPEEFAPIVKEVCKWAQRFRIPVYNDEKGKGILRHIYLRKAESTGEIMLCIVANSKSLQHSDELIFEVTDKFPAVKSIIFNSNREKTNVILGKESKVLWGQEYIEDEICSVKVRISPLSFYQVNRQQAQKLYEKAGEYASLTGNETVIDLYCGTGTIGLTMAKKAKKLIGVEIIPEAVEDAKMNAELNDINNAEFICADAEKAEEILKKNSITADVLIVDPPRKGLAPEVINAIELISPKKIVYVSCDPATLARDCAMLTEKSFTVKEVTPVDMFPRTAHVETVVLLSKLKSTHHIEVEIKMDEMDLTKSESKATYDEIKQYVFDKYDLKVSQLYIAQVKRKHGIIERINYNIGKGKNRVPQVTPEKEAAIEDALRHFKMIE